MARHHHGRRVRTPHELVTPQAPRNPATPNISTPHHFIDTNIRDSIYHSSFHLLSSRHLNSIARAPYRKDEELRKISQLASPAHHGSTHWLRRCIRSHRFKEMHTSRHGSVDFARILSALGLTLKLRQPSLRVPTGRHRAIPHHQRLRRLRDDPHLHRYHQRSKPRLLLRRFPSPQTGRRCRLVLACGYRWTTHHRQSMQPQVPPTIASEP